MGRSRLSGTFAFRARVAATVVAFALAAVVAPVTEPLEVAEAAKPSADVWSPPRIAKAQYEDEAASRKAALREAASTKVAAKPAEKPRVSAPAAGTDLAHLRRENANVTATGRAGVHRAEVFSKPINYRDEHGRWQKIDNDLVAETADTFRNKSHRLGIRFARKGASSKLASVDFSKGATVALGLAGSRPVSGRVDGPTITYPGILPDVDLRFTSQEQGFKDQIILRSRSAARTFDFPLQLRGLQAAIDPDNGAFSLTTPDGELVARSPHGWMVDSDHGHEHGEADHGTQADAQGSPEHGGPSRKASSTNLWERATSRSCA